MHTADINHIPTVTGQYDRNFQLCITLGNIVMIVASVLFMLSISVGFIFDEHFSIAAQVVAHFGTIIMPGFIKVAYVVRCIGRKHFGMLV